MGLGGQYYWYHNDHLGTPQMMTTSSGAVVWKAKYSSFGKAEIDPVSTVVSPLRFPEQYEDAETGLQYNWMRYFDAKIGRYLQDDPIGLLGGDINLF
jgi:RHS repeat-associated protein